MKIWRWFRWVLLGLGILIPGFFAATWFGMGWQLQDIDFNNPPQFIQADFLDLNKVASITKFRSGWGHEYIGNGEKCRSMKHEFMWKNHIESEELRLKMDELKKSGSPVTNEQISEVKRSIAKNRDESLAVPFYSPVNGTIKTIGESSGVGNSIEISVDNYPGWRIRMFHVWIDPDIHSGSHVVAGEHIGKSYLDIGWGDIAIHYRYVGGERLVSYFQVMPDSLFAKYQARGAKSRDDLIISKEYRDTHPLQCLNNHGETSDYAQNYTDTPEGRTENVFDLSPN